MNRTAYAALVSLVAAAACQPTTSIEVGDNTAHLAVTDPALIDAVDSFAVVLYRNQLGQNACVDLLKASVATLRAASPVVDVPLAKGSADAGHIFGSIRAGGLHSFLVLGVSGTGETPVTLANAETHVVAMGCEELDVVQQERSSLAVTLFPVGLR